MADNFWPAMVLIVFVLALLFDDFRRSGLCRKGRAARKHHWRVGMTTYQVHRMGALMKDTYIRSEAEKEFEALSKRHPQSCICLSKVDVLLSTPAQQAFNKKREQTL
jgi:hypothetical protein